MSAPSADVDAGLVREDRAADGRWHLQDWEHRWPRLAAGITAGDVDFGLGGGADAWQTTERYEELARSLGFRAAVVGRQVHGRRIVAVEGVDAGGVLITGECDGHASRTPGVLLAATAADCVPVYLLAPAGPAWALVHAGWRGAAAGVLEAAVELLEQRFGATATELHLHLGPAICGGCYEVGPEVVEALGPEAAVEKDAEGGTLRVDLRVTLARRAAAAGVPPEATSRSAWCTCCSGDHFRSYRCSDGAPGRMAAFLGWRPESRAPVEAAG